MPGQHSRRVRHRAGSDRGPRFLLFVFSRRSRHTISLCDWSSDVCSSDLEQRVPLWDELEQHFASPETKQRVRELLLEFVPERHPLLTLRTDNRRSVGLTSQFSKQDRKSVV